MFDGRIVVDGLVKQFKKVRAVDGLSFAVEPGRVTGFLGPNGAGKTTTLRMILNLVTPTAGTATIGGQRYPDLKDPLRVVGAVLEASSAHKGRTARNHLRVINAAAGFPKRRVDEVLDLVGLTPAAKRKYRGYSMGMRQRLGIAAAMLGDPRVLILDEPANGLDPEGIRWMRELLQSLAAEGRSVLVSSHLLAEMQLLADDVVIIASGQLVTQGTVDSVVESVAGPARVRVRTPHADKLIEALAEHGATVETNGNGTNGNGTNGKGTNGKGADGTGSLLVTGVAAPVVGAAALRAGVELHELVAERPDLEEAFLELTQGKADIR